MLQNTVGKEMAEKKKSTISMELAIQPRLKQKLGPEKAYLIQTGPKKPLKLQSNRESIELTRIPLMISEINQ